MPRLPQTDTSSRHRLLGTALREKAGNVLAPSPRGHRGHRTKAAARRDESRRSGGRGSGGAIEDRGADLHQVLVVVINIATLWEKAGLNKDKSRFCNNLKYYIDRRNLHENQHSTSKALGPLVTHILNRSRH